MDKDKIKKLIILLKFSLSLEDEEVLKMTLESIIEDLEDIVNK